MATIDLGKISFTQKGTYSNSTSYAPKDVVQHTDQNETSSFVKIGSTATDKLRKQTELLTHLIGRFSQKAHL